MNKYLHTGGLEVLDIQTYNLACIRRYMGDEGRKHVNTEEAKALIIPNTFG